MYFIQHKHLLVYIVDSGAGSIGDFLRENHHLVGIEDFEKAKAILSSLKSVFPKKQQGLLQLITESTFKNQIKEVTKAGKKSSNLTLLLKEKISVVVRPALACGTAKKINSHIYCPPVLQSQKTKEKLSMIPEEILPPVSKYQATTLVTEIKNPAPRAEPDQPFSDELEVQSSHSKCGKPCIQVNTHYENEFATKIKDTLKSLRDILGVSDLNMQHCEGQIKSIDNQILDELHFIEFETEGFSDSVEIVAHLHALRTKRRQLKDDLALSQMILSLFREIPTEDIGASIERIEKLSQRVYGLRAPGTHTKRGL